MLPWCRAAGQQCTQGCHTARNRQHSFQVHATHACPPTLQNWHQGAYSATRVSFSRGPSSRAPSCCLSSACTPLPSGHRSAGGGASSSPDDAETLPLCRPHSFCGRGNGGAGGRGSGAGQGGMGWEGVEGTGQGR
jgi:hypothetical protein